ncbi:uncharacterized protein [Coffea arabica]|uniref:Uncharacterized protein n=1 Tax=Coffea arabica TaxID=13443 RepID=A0A6P6UE60_COFAR|nr:uncharacterized protein LOC113709579 [Coffea arabica]
MDPEKLMVLNTDEKIKYVESLINKESRARVQMYQEFVQKKKDRARILLKLNPSPWMRGYYSTYREKHPIHYLRQALDEHNGGGHSEHVIKIKCLFHRLRNGRNSVVEEKRILRDVKCAQEECEKSCGAVRTEKFVPWELHSKGSIKYQMELLFKEMPGIWKDQKAHDQMIEHLKKGLKVLEQDIRSLQRQMENINREKGKLYAYILELKR